MACDGKLHLPWKSERLIIECKFKHLQMTAEAAGIFDEKILSGFE